MDIKPGKYTVETFARERNLSRQTAINLLSKLKKKGLARATGGGKQVRIYTITRKPEKETNGFYDIVNRYSPIKLTPSFQHYTHGRYTVEHAIIDGLRMNDARTIDAIMHLFRHVTSWKRLMSLAKKQGLQKELLRSYNHAKNKTRVKSMPRRYQR